MMDHIFDPEQLKLIIMKWFARFFLFILPILFAMGVSAQLVETKLSPDNVAGTYISFGSEIFIHNDYAFVASELQTSGIGGKVRVYHFEDESWVEVDQLNEDPTCGGPSTVSTLYGYALSGNDNFVMVGAYGWDADCDDQAGPSGTVFFYKKNGNLWESMQMVTDPNFHNTEYFGQSVDMDGDKAIAGAPRKCVTNGNYEGGAFVYDYNDANGLWEQEAYLHLDDPERFDYFGYSVGVSGDWIIVGAYETDDDGMSNNGSAFLYHFDGDDWNLEQQILSSDINSGAHFGFSVAIDGDYAIVGTENRDKVYVFKKNDDDEWVEIQILTENNPQKYGYSIDIKGDHIIVGDESYYNDDWDQLGAAFIYELNEVTGNWDFLQEVNASDGASGDLFGYRVSIDDNRAFIGAIGHDIPLEGRGAAYVFGDFVDIAADFEFDPMLAPALTDISFTDLSTADGTEITSWSWDFDDDGVEDSNLQNPVNQWVTGGAYPVTLTVSDGTVSSSVTKWVTLLSASMDSCLAYIPFNGNENDNRGAAAWNANGNGPEPDIDGHALPMPPASIEVAYYFLASRDYGNIDPDSDEAMIGNGDAVNWPALNQALANNGKTTADLEISFGMMTLGNDISGQDWEMNEITAQEWRIYTGGTYSIKLNGEEMLGGDMPFFKMDIYYHMWQGSTDDIEGETGFTHVQDLSAGSSDAAQEIAAAFIQDCGPHPIKFFFSSMQSANQSEFIGNGRNGGYFNVDQGFILKACPCELTIEASADKLLNPNEVAWLSATADNGEEPYEYVWTPAEGLSNPNSNVTQVQTDETTSYIVEVTDAEGCQAQDTVIVTIMDLGAIDGTVTDIFSGDPLAGVTVEAIGPTESSTVTTMDGTYYIGHLIPDVNYKIRFSKNEYETDSVLHVAIVGTQTTTLDFQMTPDNLGSLSGVVSDEITGTNVQGIEVTIDGTALTVTTGWDGNYLIEAIPPGAYGVTFSGSAAYQDKNVANVQLTAGEVTTLNAVLSPIIHVWTGAEDTNWNNKGNWSTDNPPPDNAHVLIPEVASGDYPATDGFQSILKLTVEPNACFTALEPGSINVSNLLIEADATGRGEVIYHMGTLHVSNPQVQQYISGNGLDPVNRQWHYITSMLDNAQASTFTGFLVNEYTEPTQDWAEIVNPNEELDRYQGLSVCAPENTVVTYEGNFDAFANEPMLTNSNPAGLNYGSGFNLIGNPHLATIDLEHADNVLNNVDNTLYFWNPILNGGVGAYQTYTIGTGGVNGQTQYAAAGQGFFVKVSSGSANGSMSLNTHAMVHNGANSFKQEELSSALRIKLQQDVFTDELLIRQNEAYHDAFSGKEDAFKLMLDNAAQIYAKSDDGKPLAITAIAMKEGELTIPLAVKSSYSDECRIDFSLSDNNSFEATFEDKLLTQIFEIEDQMNYLFVPGMDDENRFFIHLKSTTAVMEQEGSSIRAYYANGYIHIQNNGADAYELLDMGGRILQNGILNPHNGMVNLAVEIPAGVYMMQLHMDGFIINKKLIVY